LLSSSMRIRMDKRRYPHGQVTRRNCLLLLGMSSVWFSYFVGCKRLGEAANPGPTSKTLRIMSANVPGLRNHVGNMASKNWDIAVFQESGISCKILYRFRVDVMSMGSNLYLDQSTMMLLEE
jgi:hypothetical protein